MDSEFPGFLRKTPRRSDELSAFADMKFNVDNMKIIQLGITLSDENGIIAGTWEFNFKFLIETEVFYDPKSIEFLKESGIDFEELRINGIDQLFFSNMFTHVLSRHRDLKWLTFHGLYDLAYMVKLVTKKPLPVSMLDFTEIIATVFGCCVLDVKYMARLYDDLHRGELGLEKLAKILGVKRVGGSHQAGSDSLLTARVFARMKTMYGIEESRFVGSCMASPLGFANQYQAQLQTTLMYLAAIAGAQRQAPTMPPQACSSSFSSLVTLALLALVHLHFQMAPQPAMQQGAYYMQHPQAAAMAQQLGIFPPKMTLQFNRKCRILSSDTKQPFMNAGIQFN
ncbi:hypothetical protein GH714_024900 [Hevea brasiliensis]|uniref:poly(A)-specific ribonuclease n=1 Tax=Hevea brasiliensis TaxID=3981 RepID=A0A6A6KRB6_HEVBR|nr:hypothetical protein GH714_024900 [Hevea brasiliensis]